MSQSGMREPTRLLLWLIIAIVLAFGILAVVVSFTMTGWTGHPMMGLGFAWMGIIMAIPAIVIVLILLAVLGNLDTTYQPKSSALRTLELRLARGEIGLEEFGRLKEELER